MGRAALLATGRAGFRGGQPPRRRSRGGQSPTHDPGNIDRGRTHPFRGNFLGRTFEIHKLYRGRLAVGRRLERGGVFVGGRTFTHARQILFGGLADDGASFDRSESTNQRDFPRFPAHGAPGDPKTIRVSQVGLAVMGFELFVRKRELTVGSSAGLVAMGFIESVNRQRPRDFDRLAVLRVVEHQPSPETSGGGRIGRRANGIRPIRHHFDRAAEFAETARHPRHGRPDIEARAAARQRRQRHQEKDRDFHDRFVIREKDRNRPTWFEQQAVIFAKRCRRTGADRNTPVRPVDDRDSDRNRRVRPRFRSFGLAGRRKAPPNAAANPAGEVVPRVRIHDLEIDRPGDLARRRAPNWCLPPRGRRSAPRLGD